MNNNITYQEWMNEARSPFLRGISNSIFSKDGAATVGMGTYGSLAGAGMAAITGGSIAAGVTAGALGAMGLYRFSQMGKGKRGRPKGTTKVAKIPDIQNLQRQISHQDYKTVEKPDVKLIPYHKPTFSDKISRRKKLDDELFKSLIDKGVIEKDTSSPNGYRILPNREGEFVDEYNAQYTRKMEAFAKKKADAMKAKEENEKKRAELIALRDERRKQIEAEKLERERIKADEASIRKSHDEEKLKFLKAKGERERIRRKNEEERLMRQKLGVPMKVSSTKKSDDKISDKLLSDFQKWRETKEKADKIPNYKDFMKGK